MLTLLLVLTILILVSVFTVFALVILLGEEDNPMLGRYIDEARYSHANQKPGWVCSRVEGHEGPCALHASAILSPSPDDT